MRRLRNLFITGLLTVLPLWLVWVVVKFVFLLLSDLSLPWVEPTLNAIAASNPEVLGWVNHPAVLTIGGLLSTLAVIIAAGVFARRVVGQRSLAWFESLVARVPLVNTVYGSARKLLDLVQTKPGSTQRVVLIDFPHSKMKSVGLVTRTLVDVGTGTELAAVYVPTTPNPTSGYLEIVPVDQLTPVDWSVDEAVAFIISGGAVSREKIQFSRETKPGNLDIAPV
jgi:uncharacterized membrane protein